MSERSNCGGASGCTIAAAAGVAAAVSLAVMAATLPMSFVTGSGSYWLRGDIDAVQSAAALRLFLAAPWCWPLLRLPLLGPHGINAGNADILPLIALPMKLAGMRWVNPYGWWVALCYPLTAAAAARAAWLAGARTLAAAAAVGLLASMLPAFQLRLMHASLETQAFIPAAVELYLRRRSGRPWPAAEAALPPLAFAVHPYFVAFTGAVLGAGFLRDAVRPIPGRRVARILQAALPLAAAALCVAALAVGFGMSVPPPGAHRQWGLWSLNILAPVWPSRSALFGFPPLPDMTGGQFEPRAWLGTGMIALAWAAAWACRGRWGSVLRTHGWLLAACLACTAYAVTTRAWLGPWRLLDFYPEPLRPWLEVFRASGRFIWVPEWVLLILGAGAVARQGRSGAVILALLAVLQAVDTAPVRAEARATALLSRGPAFDWRAVDAAAAGASRLEVYPVYDCALKSDAVLAVDLDLEVLASLSGKSVTTARSARRSGGCGALAAQAARPGSPPGVLRIFVTGPMNRAGGQAGPAFPAWTAACEAVPADAGAMMRLCRPGAGPAASEAEKSPD